MGRNKSCDKPTRDIIIKLREKNWSLKKIADCLQCSKTMVFHAVKHYNTFQTTSNMPRIPRPRKTSRRDDRNIILLAKQFPLKGSSEIQKDLYGENNPSAISARTIRRRLVEENMFGRIARKTAAKQQRRTPAGLFRSNSDTESSNDLSSPLVDKEDSIYERDVSSIKTEGDKAPNETDSSDDRVTEDDSIYECHVSSIKTEGDKAPIETDCGDDRVNEDDSIYEPYVSPIKTEGDKAPSEAGSGDDRVNEDDSIYEHHVSPIKTEGDKAPSGADSSDDRVNEDDSIYEHHVSPIKTEDDHGGEATVPEGSSRRHEGCRCDVCRADIVGFRYACVQCENFDLCSACEARGEHATHYVLRIPPDKLHSDVQVVIERIRDQLLEEQAIKVEVKEEVLERDPLEETTRPDADSAQETSCQDTKSEESEDPLDVNLLDRSEREKTPLFKVSPSYPPYVPQDQPFQSQQNLRNASHQPQAPAHQPTVPKFRSHQSKILIRQPRILIRKLKVASTTPEVPSKVPRVLSHQPQISPSATCQEKRPLMLEDQTSTSEELKPAEKKRKELKPARKKRKGLIV